MASPITRRQRELSNLAIVIAQQQESIEGLQRYLRLIHDAKDELVRREATSNEERATLLAENTNLRRAAKRMIAAGTKKGLRRELQGVFESVMGEES